MKCMSGNESTLELTCLPCPEEKVLILVLLTAVRFGHEASIATYCIIFSKILLVWSVI